MQSLIFSSLLNDDWTTLRFLLDQRVFPSLLSEGNVTDPGWLVFLVDGRESAVFGLDYASREEVAQGILDRACDWLRLSMVSPQLARCEAFVISPHARCRFVYDPENWEFVENNAVWKETQK
jgi:hypothetical protein